ncbi:hypothetical protein R3Q06_10620 [Rhodococcus erythropolis]|uniref:hypothetical protein n=1 Tax=Rhodococcus erythropolis TaxID=1833 RepID=UPI002949A4DE|nr:hypothetical protein [Rhodococcus erythropolis]MDV6273951.1 hypothetical protein [Rhodococcus erythropolis]
MTDQPLVEEARVKFTGLSSEYFDLPASGEQRTYTVLATRTDKHEKRMATEGDRVTVTMKIDKVVEGVSEKIHETDEEPSLFDSAIPVPESDGGSDDETPSNVTDFTGPTFSSDE